jgi:2,3-bisphosphoglycerate-dependent phosphoglycerate mutase
METMTGTLVLLRHGESEWNAKNLFTGWVDVDLNAKGEAEARRGGELLKEAGLLPDVLHTSVLRRAIQTSHYGALQGKDKKQTLEAYGEEQFMLWRRSYDVPPPPIEPGDEFAQFDDPRYANLPPELKPKSECLKDVLGRTLPYWYDAIVPDLIAGKTVLVAAHGNSLRAIVKHLDQVSDEAIAKLNIPTGIPLRYDLDAGLRPVTKGGAYLDPEAAAEGAAAVANQGR